MKMNWQQKFDELVYKLQIVKERIKNGQYDEVETRL